MNILFLTALEAEFSLLPTFNHHCKITYIGIGKVAAAIKAFDAIKSATYDLVLNVGTAGSIDLPIGEIVCADRFVDRDMEQVKHLGVEWELCMKDLLSDHYHTVFSPNRTCNTGDNFLIENGTYTGDVFDMEAFSIAKVCSFLETPFLSIKYVTDRVGENNYQSWEEKLADAKQGLEAHVEELLYRL